MRRRDGCRARATRAPLDARAARAANGEGRGGENAHKADNGPGLICCPHETTPKQITGLLDANARSTRARPPDHGVPSRGQVGPVATQPPPTSRGYDIGVAEQTVCQGHFAHGPLLQHLQIGACCRQVTALARNTKPR